MLERRLSNIWLKKPPVRLPLRDLEASDIVPHAHRSFSQFAMMLGCHLMVGNMEEVGDWVVDGDEALELTC